MQQPRGYSRSDLVTAWKVPVLLDESREHRSVLTVDHHSQLPPPSSSTTLTTMSNYTAAPPSYQTASPTKARDEEAGQPLLSPRAGPSGGAYYDQPSADDLPDDFKVDIVFLSPHRCFTLTTYLQYGTSVSDSAPEIRRAFVRKVYSILCEYMVSCYRFIPIIHAHLALSYSYADCKSFMCILQVKI